MSNKLARCYPASVIGKLCPCGVHLKVLSVVLVECTDSSKAELMIQDYMV